MQCGMERGFAHLSCKLCCNYFLVKLSLFFFLIRDWVFSYGCVPHLCVEWMTAEAVWQLVRETSGAVMSQESWIPSL